MKFGTDGIRGNSKDFITPELAYKFGRAFSSYSISAKGFSKFAVARDTRNSGLEIEKALLEGITDAGSSVISIGIMPTPALSEFILDRGLSGGVMITASHNPPEDNGLKPLGFMGKKLNSKEIIGIENFLLKEIILRNRKESVCEVSDGHIPWLKKIWSEIEFSESVGSLIGEKIVVDSANGAARFLAGQALSYFGAKVIQISNEDGDKINLDCGSLYPQKMVQAVKENGAIAGIALDGDGDRIQICDKEGILYDGDDILWMLRGNSKSIVGTIMTNEGLSISLKEKGSFLHRVAVGDANISEGMEKYWSPIGGEPSGHILFERGFPTSCGTFTAAKLLALNPIKWNDLTKDLKRTYQAIGKIPIQNIDNIRNKAKEISCSEIRIVIRESGTEPIIRIMVECNENKKAENVLNSLLCMAST